MLEVLEPGLLTTVQDGGRPDAVNLGVPIGGACDAWSLAVANLLVDNVQDAPALEITLLGPSLLAIDSMVVALAGADLGARIPESSGVVLPGTVAFLRAGQRLTFSPEGRVAGVRAYLAVPGGIDVPRVLGSAGTCLIGGFGGVDGRPLRAGDRIHAAGRPTTAMQGRHWPNLIPNPVLDRDAPIRVLPGPHVDQLPAGILDAFLSEGWKVGTQSDRVGLRLEGAQLDAGPNGGDLISLPVVWGAVQLPPGGRPIVLLADCQTIGGYPVLAVVIRADRPRLGQCAPGDEIHFTLVDQAAAGLASVELSAALSDAEQYLTKQVDWDGLGLWAGA